MYCAYCSEKAVPGATFCHKCGKPHAKTSKVSKPEKSAYPTEGLEDFKSFVRTRFILKCLRFPVAYGSALYVMMDMTPFAVFPLIPVFAICWYMFDVKQRHYRKFKGSVDANGEHRCMSCGGRGIYRQGGYASDKVTASCSKCGQYFWTERTQWFATSPFSW